MSRLLLSLVQDITAQDSRVRFVLFLFVRFNDTRLRALGAMRCGIRSKLRLPILAIIKREIFPTRVEDVYLTLDGRPLIVMFAAACITLEYR